MPPAEVIQLPQSPGLDPIPGYLTAGQVHLFGGSPHVGKSTIVAQLAEAVSTGQPFLELPTNQITKVVVVFTDRTSLSNMTWIDKLTTRPSVYSMGDDREYIRKLEGSFFKVPRGFPEFKYMLDKVNPAPGTLIVADVFSNVFTGRVMVQEEVRDNLLMIGHKIAALGVTVVGTCYGVKIQNDVRTRYSRFIDRIIGASTFRGGASCLMYLTTPGESDLGGIQELELAPRTGRTSTIIPVRRLQNGLYERVSDAEVIQFKASREKASVTECIQAVLVDSSQPIGPKEISEQAGLNYGTVRVTMRRMLDAGKISVTDEGKYFIQDPAAAQES